MSPRSVWFLAALLAICTSSAHSQVPPFDVASYASFLATHQEMSGDELLALHPAGWFAQAATTSFSSALFADSVALKLSLTTYEKSLIEQHGFMVSERLSTPSFGSAFRDIYHKDLPAFVSSDALLHAWHMSYDEILKDVETSLLIRRLDTLLAALHGRLPAATYSGNPGMRQMLIDVDLYLTIPRRLLGSSAGPVYPENMTAVSQILAYIAARQPVKIPLFQSVERYVDFSQFTPRGHYTQSVELTRYFQAMIWLGRTELILLPPLQADVQPTEADMQRQAIDAVLLHEAALASNGYTKLNEIDQIIRFFVGESDNITLPQIQAMVGEAGLNNASALLDTLTFRNFCSLLEQKSYAFQRINSQILLSDVMSPQQVRPAGAFLLLGQRFVIDSYVTGSVVFDKIMYQGHKVLRMLPSTLDILYALGNDASAQLLKPDLEQYHYGSNLAALRYVVDSYEPDFWRGILYNGWLRALKTLNPPSSRATLPPFMHTAAWWQEKMNTQLAAWAQLRHDNLLYAKQSYTPIPVCSFPEAFVEPVPGFYDAMHEMADSAAAIFRSSMLASLPNGQRIVSFFKEMAGTLDTLGTIARKELAASPLTGAETTFLKQILYEVTDVGCVTIVELLGWYPRLFYTGKDGLLDENRVVADVHTSPADENGFMVGWVMHAGTGPVDMAVVVTTLPDGRSVACVGPVLSYYEHVTTNFKRLTDEEWKTLYAVSPSFRPPLVNLYLADVTGASRGAGPSLATDIAIGTPPGLQPTSVRLEQNFPNPFNGQTVIAFSIPPSLSGSAVNLVVYDLQGRCLRTLLHQKMPPGRFLARWNGDTESGAQAASGIYFYQLRVGPQMRTGKMALVR
jgi:hypothetical protein